MMARLRKLYERHREVLTYLFFGGATTLVNWVSYGLLVRGLSLSVAVGNAIAWLVAVLFAFITNKLWVFRSPSFQRAVVIKEMLSFFGMRALSGLVEILGVPLLVGLGLSATLFGIEGFLAKAIISLLVILLNYIFSVLVVFRKGR